jgi:hypothetical protein
LYYKYQGQLTSKYQGQLTSKEDKASKPQQHDLIIKRKSNNKRTIEKVSLCITNIKGNSQANIKGNSQAKKTKLQNLNNTISS